jgi:nucleoside-diphosphate-sugar epimerase
LSVISTDATESRALVTGATGFIGLRLVRRLLEAGATVYAGVAPGEDPERVAALPAPVRCLVFDLRDAEAVRSAVAEAAPQVVVHLAAVGVTNPAVDPALALAVNVGGALHLLEASRERAAGGGDVRRIVFVGTCHEYGARGAAGDDCHIGCLDPVNAYAASKVAAWAFGRVYWRAHGLPVVTVRPFQVYGPGQPAHTLVPAAIRAALAGEDFSMTPGEQARDFVYVDDVVAGMLAAVQAPGVEGDSLDLGTGYAHTVRQVVERVWAVTGARGQVLPGARPYRPGVAMCLVADADRTARLTGWRAQVDLEEGLRRTIESMKAIDEQVGT